MVWYEVMQFQAANAGIAARSSRRSVGFATPPLPIIVLLLTTGGLLLPPMGTIPG